MSTTAPRSPAAHLEAHRWKPGQSGNPHGTRKFSVIKECKQALRGVYGDKYLAKNVALRLLDIALNKKTKPGSVIAALTLLFQYLEPKPAQRLQIEDADKQRKAYSEALEWFRQFRDKDGNALGERLALEGLLQVHPDARDVIPEVFEIDE
jgi:hypothetical protein